MTPNFKYNFVVAYKITDLMFLSSIQEICNQAKIELKNVSRLSKVEEEVQGRGLIVCDLVSISGELETIMRFARTKAHDVLGYYPHVNKQIETRARSLGVNYITPRSGLRLRLKSLVS